MLYLCQSAGSAELASCQSYLASNSEYIKQFCFLCFRYRGFPEHSQHAMRQELQCSDHSEARNIDNPDIVNSEMGGVIMAVRIMSAENEQ